MNDFEIYNPTHLFFGKSKKQQFLKRISTQSKRLLLVIGGGSIKRAGYLDEVIQTLEQFQVQVHHFEGIEPNPELKTIQRAIEYSLQKEVNGILAFGGGSVMDASKVIGLGISHRTTDVWDFRVGGPNFKSAENTIPVYCIPTTAATASEVTPYAVISHREIKEKQSFVGRSLKPVASWLNPVFTQSLPWVSTADGAADIISHAIESYLLGGNDAPLTDRYAESVMKTVIETLPKLKNDLENENLRSDLLWASNLALNDYHSAGRNPSMMILHVLEHALSGVRPELAHGRGLATLYPAYFKWLLINNHHIERLSRLGQALFDISEPDDELMAQEFILQFSDWLRQNDLHQSLSDLNFSDSNLEKVIQILNAHAPKGGFWVDGPFTEADIKWIFEKTEEQKSS